MSADPTTLLGTILSLQLRKEDKKAKKEAELEEDRYEKRYKKSQVEDGGYTDFTDWNTGIISIYRHLLFQVTIF